MRCCCAASALTQSCMAPLQALEEAGCFALVLECLPNTVSAAVTSELNIPTIGIGAGGACSGQVKSQGLAAAAEALGMRLACRAAAEAGRQCKPWQAMNAAEGWPAEQLQEQRGGARLGKPGIARNAGQ